MCFLLFYFFPNFKPEKDREREGKKSRKQGAHCRFAFIYKETHAIAHGIINFIAPPRLMNRRKKRDSANSGEETKDKTGRERKTSRSVESNKRTKDAAAAVTTL